MKPCMSRSASDGARFRHDLETELTFDDPTLYTRPFTVKIGYGLIPNNDIFEMFCTQNEKDRAHMVK